MSASASSALDDDRARPGRERSSPLVDANGGEAVRPWPKAVLNADARSGWADPDDAGIFEARARAPAASKDLEAVHPWVRCGTHADRHDAAAVSGA